ncbi:MAG: protein-glutamate O-methyltransferase CheR [Clostridia bacterium]|nr:MAG: protein-glutamate O-methyltransferase CheR [Clostridia bacterium]
MEFEEFIKRVSASFGLNLEGYKETQLKRRIEGLMRSLGVADYQTYYRLITSDAEQKKKFLDRITINVSEFFRNPEAFAYLAKEILPELAGTGTRLKVWSAGCANGVEPYSLAILLYELAPRGGYLLEATDIDDQVLAVARDGKYPETLLRNLSQAYRQKYFIPSDGFYAVKPILKQNLVFRHHDLLLDTFGQGYDLIVCRNVTIYFTRETQENLYRKFHQALRPGGVLFVGATESILQYRQFGYEKIASWFYRKG